MKYIVLIGVLLSLLILKPTTLNDIENQNNRKISVEVSGHVNNPGMFEMDNFSVFDDLISKLDLKDNSDYSHYSKQKRLIHHDVIVIREKTTLKPVSINSGTLEDFTTLKGIGDKIAQRIIDYRNHEGNFKKLEDLMNVKGIGEKVFQNIKDFITL